jgi:hypothetical protein
LATCLARQHRPQVRASLSLVSGCRITLGVRLNGFFTVVDEDVIDESEEFIVSRFQNCQFVSLSVCQFFFSKIKGPLKV